MKMRKLKILALLSLLFITTALSPVSYIFAACPANQVETGIGCVPTDAPGLAAFLVKLIVGIAGGVTLLLLIAGGAQYIASSGDPDSIDEAKEKITAAVSGILLIILSLVVLKVLGVDILGLPGFEGLPDGKLKLPGP